jgi:hypothetical protein
MRPKYFEALLIEHSPLRCVLAATRTACHMIDSILNLMCGATLGSPIKTEMQAKPLSFRLENKAFT